MPEHRVYYARRVSLSTPSPIPYSTHAVLTFTSLMSILKVLHTRLLRVRVHPYRYAVVRGTLKSQPRIERSYAK